MRKIFYIFFAFTFVLFFLFSFKSQANAATCGPHNLNPACALPLNCEFTAGNPTFGGTCVSTTTCGPHNLNPACATGLTCSFTAGNPTFGGTCIAPAPPGGGIGGDLAEVGCGAGQVPTLDCIFPLIATVIFWALTFAATVATFFIVFAGIRILTSGGDPKNLETGKKTFTYAILGLILIFLSFFIINTIADITGVACLNVNKPMTFSSCG